ncbi:transposable element Tcb2 transposase [Trichonephila clavipes]|nr:transposable element Tcb2 transposase [Trichonephila clavipes]
MNQGSLTKNSLPSGFKALLIFFGNVQTCRPAKVRFLMHQPDSPLPPRDSLYGDAVVYVAREFDIAHSIVSRLWKSFKTTGMCSRRHGGGRVRSTTPAEDRYIVLSAKRNRRTTAQQVANQFLAASGKQIFRKTVTRRLRGGGLYARRPDVCVPLTRQHRTARLQ